MAARDLTDKFVSYRSRNPKKRNGSNDFSDGKSEGGLLDGAANTVNWSGARDQLPPLWVDMVDQVEEDIRQIQQKMKELSNSHTKRLMVTFDDTNEAERDRDIEVTTQAITGLFHHAEGILRKVGAGTPTPSEAKVRENIQRSLARKLQSLSITFRNSQKEYLQRVRAQKSGNEGFEFLQEENKQKGFGAKAQDTGFTQQQMSVLEDTETLVQERDEEINKIVKSIEELSTIFKELAVLVIDQGTVLDRIDFNMELVVDHVKEGIGQLEKAEGNQKSARPIKCIIALLVLIAVMLAILIAKHARHNGHTVVKVESSGSTGQPPK